MCNTAKYNHEQENTQTDLFEAFKYVTRFATLSRNSKMKKQHKFKAAQKI